MRKCCSVLSLIVPYYICIIVHRVVMVGGSYQADVPDHLLGEMFLQSFPGRPAEANVSQKAVFDFRH